MNLPSSDRRKVFEVPFLLDSGRFDFSFYRSQIGADSPSSPEELVNHYLNKGQFQDITPSWLFKHSEYRISREYILTSCGLSPFSHFLLHGRQTQEATGSVLYLSHDASLTGAPSVLLQIIEANTAKGIPGIALVGGQDATQIDKFYEFCPTLRTAEAAQHEIQSFLSSHLIDVVYCNTVASAAILEAVLSVLSDKSTPRLIVAHIHELESVQQHFECESRFLLSQADHVIAVSQKVKESCQAREGYNHPNYSVIQPFIRPANFQPDQPADYPETPTIWGCGTIEFRKGFDLFCEVASILNKRISGKFRLAWIGPSSTPEEPTRSLEKFGVTDLITLHGKIDNPSKLYKPRDIFFMCSREDPFPLVCLEAGQRGLPIVCFDERAGGISSFIRASSGGLICDYLNTDDAAKTLEILINDLDLRIVQGENAKQYVTTHHLTTAASEKIQKILYPSTQEKSLDEDRALRAATSLKLCVVSFGPPPLPGIKAVEGGGLRCWGLATGIKTARPSWEVCMIYPKWYEGYNTITNHPHESGVSLYQWENQDDISRHLQSFDAVIISYCYGSYSSETANSLSEHQTLILDCYVPIHIEVSARKSIHRIDEERSFLSDSTLWNRVISKGHLLLCASHQQKLYYLGLLSGLGRITPISYDQCDNIVIAPFGITGSLERVPSGNLDHQSFEHRDHSSEPFQLLWFGGVYPWFDMTNLFDAVGMINDSISCELTIVGIKNPFNHHPWFKKVALNLLSLSEQERYQRFIRVEEWVPYEDRTHYYERADLAICINAIGIENMVSWRTRILDYLWASLPFATNGGDPISELLIDAELGMRIDATSTESLAVTLREAIQKIQNTPSSSSSKNPKLDRLQMQMQWSAIGDTIARAVSNVRAR